LHSDLIYFLVLVFGNFGTALISLIGDLVFHGIELPSSMAITTTVVIAACFLIAQLAGIKAWEYLSI